SKPVYDARADTLSFAARQGSKQEPTVSEYERRGDEKVSASVGHASLFIDGGEEQHGNQCKISLFNAGIGRTVAVTSVATAGDYDQLLFATVPGGTYTLQPNDNTLRPIGTAVGTGFFDGCGLQV